MLLLCLAALGASAAQSAAPPSDVELVTKVRLTADRIEYSGIITAEANAGVFELYESAQPKPTALWIESQGGSAGAGMQLGSWVFDNGLDVEVDTYCFSSCANYVFPAGRTKVLASRASLMWHGGVTQPITLSWVVTARLTQASCSSVNVTPVSWRRDMSSRRAATRRA